MIKSKKFQDTAGLIRGSFRIFHGYQANSPQSIYSYSLDHNVLSNSSNAKFSDELKKPEVLYTKAPEEQKKPEKQEEKFASIKQINEEIPTNSKIKISENLKVVNFKNETPEKQKVEIPHEKTRKNEEKPQPNPTIESDNMINVQAEGLGEGFKVFSDPKSKKKSDNKIKNGH